MLKKMIAWILVLALVVSVMPQLSLGATAEGEQQIPAAHSHSAAQHDCEHCDNTITWTAWEKTDSLPNTTGHYYLTDNVEVTVRTTYDSTDNVVICLNGFHVDAKGKDLPFYLQDTAKLTISDCTAYTDAEDVFHAGKLTGGRATGSMPSTVFAKGSAQFALYNCIVAGNVHVANNNTAEGYGGAVHGREKTVGHLENVLFENNTCERDGGAVNVNGANARMTVKNCVFRNNTAVNGGAIYVKNATNVTVEGSTFETNTATNGSAIYMNGGHIDISDSTFAENTVTGASGGAVRLNIATVSMDACTMTGNIGKNSGGSAIHAGGGKCLVTLNDCVITDNVSTGTINTYRGAVYMTNTTDCLVVSGATVIEDNRVATGGTPIERNIFIQTPVNPVDVGGLTKGASISIHTRNSTAAEANMVKAEKAPAEWNQNWVVYENTGKAIAYSASEGFYFADIIGHAHCLCGAGPCTDSTHTEIDFQEWEYTDSLPASGNYYLRSDVVLSGEAVISENLNLCLNGHTVTQTKDGERVIGVTSGKVCITGCNGGAITGGNVTSGSGGGIDVNGDKAELSLNNITVTGNNASGNGGGIAVRSGGKLTVIGGKVTNNGSTKDGAGIYAQAGTEVSITNTEVASNSVASGAGGGVAISGKATLTDVTIKNNKSSGAGAGMVVQGSSIVTMNGGSVTGNEASGTGGGVYALKQLTLNNVTITGNTAKKLADGVYVAADNVLTITGNTVVKDNGSTNLYLKSDCNVNFSKLGSNAHISLSVLDNKPRVISGQTAEDPTAYLYSDSADLYPAYKNGVVSLEETIKHTHCLCGGGDQGCDHGTVSYMKWEKTDSLPTSGTYYLENDVVLTGEISISGNLTLCLNGKTITAAKGKRIMSNPKNVVATVTISDCTAKTVDGVYTAGSFRGGEDLAGTAGGGFMYVRAGGVLKLYDGIITECTSTLQGGAICLAESTKMEMHGGEISDCTAVASDGTTWKKGGAVAVYKAEFLMTAGTVKNNKANNGAISSLNKSTVTITGGTVCDNWASADGGGVYANDSGLYISGTASIYGNESQASGGNICYGGNSYGSVSDITVEGGKASAGAGAMVQNGAEVVFTNVTIKNNASANVAGAIRLYKADLTLDNCTITGNTAKECAAISAESSATLTIKDGSICDNTATSSVGGVLVESDVSLTLAGKTVISGNTTGNLLLEGGALMDVSGVSEGAEIHLSADMGVISKPCQDVSAYFKSESVYRAVVYRDGALYMATDGSHKHCNCFGDDQSCDHAVIEWAAWESTNSLPKSGNYYLLNDVVLTSEQSISDEVRICLNGHTVTAAEGKRHISTVKNKPAHIVICDCTAATKDGIYTAGKLQGGVDKSGNTGGGSIYLRAGASLELFDGIITNNTSTLAGGAVSLNSGSSFIMHGGEISGNKCLAEDGKTWKDGGAIYSVSGNTIKILGGAIKNNEAHGGGGIRFNGAGEFVIAGGTISGNIAHGQGGGVFASTATVTITGGQIIENQSTSSAGGVCLGTKAVATMTAGSIKNNTAPSGGGMILQGGTVLNLTGGEIVKNTSTGTGGGVGMYSKSQLIVTGASISNNTSRKDGAGIYVRESYAEINENTLISGNVVTDGSGGGISYGTNSTGKITGGVIEKNEAGGGAGLMIQNGANVEITNVELKNNTAKTGNGGGIRAYKATLTISGGNYQNNKALKSGGGCIAATTNSTLIISGGTYQNNKAVKSGGGGIFASGESVFTMTGGTVKNNSAKSAGGGIYVNKCTANISGITVTGNTCERDGAGIYNTAGLMNIKGNVVSSNNYTKGNGGGVCYGSKSTGHIYGITITNNKVDAGGGAMIIQGNAYVTIGSAYIAGNTAKNTAGGIYLYKAGMTMTGGYIGENTATGSGGGIYATGATKLELSGVTITKNTGKSGGGLYALRCRAIVKDSEISYNESTGSGAGFYTSGSSWDAAISGGEFTNVKIIGNHGGVSCSGAAAYINSDVAVSFTNCEIADNVSELYGGGIYAAAGAVPTMVDCTITGNQAAKNGGGMLVRDCGELTNCYFANNKADNGAAIFGGNYMETFSVNGWGSKGDDIGLFVTDCTFENNAANTNGGAFYLDMSCYTTMDRCTFTGNTAGAQGSALWLWENCTMTNLTVTGNKCENSGYAVFMADSEFDGQTYINGLFKMGGDMIIKDNEGGDLFLANKVTIGALHQGYGENTHMVITLDAGLLTQRVLGEYNYEGGQLNYTLTYGDRSMTDPEYLAPQETETDPTENETQATDTDENGESGNAALYAGIGGIAAVIVIAAVILIVAKKKKTPAGDKE